MIAVIDTNVWISALIFSKPGSIPGRVLERIFLHDRLATSIEMRDELYVILTERYGWTSDRLALELSRFQSGALVVSLRHNVHVCRDPKDNMFLECAALARADVLVTGDNDLLSLENYLQTKILTPAQYLNLP